MTFASMSGGCGRASTETDVAPYLDEDQPLDIRVEDALSRMTLEEKVALLHAQSKFSSKSVPSSHANMFT